MWRSPSPANFEVEIKKIIKRGPRFLIIIFFIFEKMAMNNKSLELLSTISKSVLF